MSEMVRVVLVDDHRVVRQGLRSYLESFPDLQVIGEASNGEEALKYLPDWLPDVVVMDLLMPGGIDGVETIRRLSATLPQIRVIALTSYSDDARVIAVLRAGARGYVRKDAAPAILLTAIRAAAQGQTMLDPAIAGSSCKSFHARKSLGIVSLNVNARYCARWLWGIPIKRLRRR